jgi:hypothetical protein
VCGDVSGIRVALNVPYLQNELSKRIRQGELGLNQEIPVFMKEEDHHGSDVSALGA